MFRKQPSTLHEVAENVSQHSHFSAFTICFPKFISVAAALLKNMFSSYVQLATALCSNWFNWPALLTTLWSFHGNAFVTVHLIPLYCVKSVFSRFILLH